MSRKWSSTLCNCCVRPQACLVSYCVPGGYCLLQAYAVDGIKHQGILVPYCLVCQLHTVGGALNRETIRDALDIEGSYGNSYCIWCFCRHCAAVQEYNEVLKVENKT